MGSVWPGLIHGSVGLGRAERTDEGGTRSALRVRPGHPALSAPPENRPQTTRYRAPSGRRIRGLRTQDCALGFHRSALQALGHIDRVTGKWRHPVSLKGRTKSPGPGCGLRARAPVSLHPLSACYRRGSRGGRYFRRTARQPVSPWREDLVTLRVSGESHSFSASSLR